MCHLPSFRSNEEHKRYFEIYSALSYVGKTSVISVTGGLGYRQYPCGMSPVLAAEGEAGLQLDVSGTKEGMFFPSKPADSLS